jgi:uncharacterized protein (DUF952 family)
VTGLDNIYHICSSEAWEETKKGKKYRSESLVKEGFIHCSKYEQVLRVANTFYHGQKNLVLLVIESGKVKAKLIWEPGSDKPDELFPHIYGSLNLDAINQVLDLEENPNGKFYMPTIENNYDR